MRPVVGIPLCLDDRGRWRSGREYTYIDAAYVRAVDAAGGLSLQLPIQRDPEALVARIDALLLPGGDDLPPDDASRYPDDVRFDLAPEAQLAFDRRLLEAALDRDLPVLGICYGMQLLALHFGGKLDHHLPIDAPGAGNHQLPDDGATHPLVIEPNTRLAKVLGDPGAGASANVRAGAVNSLHHQAVREPGRGLRVCARADDGVVEAIERDGPGFCLGVQWHPEKLPGKASDRLFAALVAAAAERDGSRAARTG